MEKIILNGDGIQVVQITYPSYTTELQKGITALMDRCVTRAANCTLGELGYLHRSSLVMSDDGQYHLRVFFDARYATRRDPNNPSRRIPVSGLADFKNYMFVGDIGRAIHIEVIAGPETEDFIDEASVHSLRVVDQDESLDTTVLVLECNIQVAMAAMADVSLFDPAFRVIPKTDGNRADNPGAKIVRAIDREVPVTLTVEYTASDQVEPYDPKEAVPYLRAMRERMTDGKKALRRVRDDVTHDANEKRREAGRSTAFGRFA